MTIIQKNCKWHGITDFKFVGNSNKTFCVQCSRDKTKYRRYAQKIKAINYLGNCCNKCKNSFEDISVYDFHHLKDKSNEISLLITKNFKFEQFKTELDKCELLCSNCHCEHHDENLELKQNKSYNSNYTVEKRQEIKLKVIEFLGGKCSECNYNKSVRALHPHHLYDKNFSIGGDGRIMKWVNIENELVNCVLLCSNCHRKKHSLFNNLNIQFLNRYL